MTPDSKASPLSTASTRLRNFLIVLAAITLSVVFGLSVNSKSTALSLNDLALASTPYETAVTNGKPTFLEFYANWCTSCQSMAPSIGQMKTQYADDVNFVMLNVDNNKWLPEIMKFRVDGIPHFVYMDKTGTPIASVIGEQPIAVLAENLSALTQDKDLPFIQKSGQTSRLDSTAAPKPTQDDPRSHGAQVVKNS